MKKILNIITLFFSVFFTACDNPLFMDAIGIYDVSFESNGGTAVDSVRTDVIEILPKTEKENCDFLGWYETSAFSDNAVTFPYKVKQKTVLYAKWNQKYKVQFDAGNGTTYEETLVSQITSLPVPQKEGYTFAGWYNNSYYSGNAVTVPYELTSDVILYAKWNKNYTVHFNSNGGNEIKSVNCGILTELPAVEKENYEFAGWYVSSSYSGEKINVPYSVTEDITLYAKWLPTYLISFDVDGGSEIPSFRAREVESVQSPEKSGFVFIEWYSDSTFINKVQFPLVLTGDITLYAYYKKNYKIYFESNGGTEIESINSYYVEELPEPELSNKTFAGWYTNPEFLEDSKITLPFEPDEDTILYAKWVAEMWKITYDGNGETSGSVPDVVMVEKGSSFTVSANTGNLKKAGYAFTKWSTSKTGTSGQTYTAGQDITPEKNMTLYAQWGKDYAEMLPVEGGWFYFGSSDSSSERPKITLSGFQIAKYELTYELWLEVYTWATENGYGMTSVSKGYSENDKYKDFVPATNISWNMACVFCNAYSAYKGFEPVYYRGDAVWKDDTKTSGTFSWERTKNGYRLPTECEWEFAAGGGNAETHDQYAYSGSNIAEEVAWKYSNSGKEAHPVGTKKANTLGIYDMSGNVAEWCYDYYADFSTGELTNPLHESGTYRCIRGCDCIRISCNSVSISERYGADVRVKEYYFYTGNSTNINTNTGYESILGIRIARNAE